MKTMNFFYPSKQSGAREAADVGVLLRRRKSVRPGGNVEPFLEVLKWNRNLQMISGCPDEKVMCSRGWDMYTVKILYWICFPILLHDKKELKS